MIDPTHQHHGEPDNCPIYASFQLPGVKGVHVHWFMNTGQRDTFILIMCRDFNWVLKDIGYVRDSRLSHSTEGTRGRGSHTP